ncbi:MAG: alpha/beta fold hydrolase [Patescibacteria group bacterium]|nr:MAG: alpha/beta fold hydrolase [Patescibacteria group bacterium]
MKKQIIFIHGGETFDTYDGYIGYLNTTEFDPDEFKPKRWKDSLGEDLGSDFQVIAPVMPSKYNSKYNEWKIWFEKTFPFLEDNVVLIGHSLGGIFVAKYLSENNFPKKISATYLIAAPFDNKDSECSLADFVLPQTLEKFEGQGGKIFIYQSKDDPVVPFVDLEKYAKSLPTAEMVVFKDKGHFIQEEFPELIQSILQLRK